MAINRSEQRYSAKIDAINLVEHKQTGQVSKHGGSMSEYTKQADDFMARHGLEFRAVHIGPDCPTFCTDADKMTDMDKINVYPRQTHIHGHHYHVTISAKDRGHFTIDFWNSYADEEHNWCLKNSPYDSDCRHVPYSVWAQHGMNPDHLVRGKKKQVVPYDVLACLTKNDPGTFEDFCADFGYEEDSRRAEPVYFAVQKEWRKMQRFFTEAEIAELQEIS